MGFLDNLFPNKKEKAPKSDRSRRPQSQVSRPPARPAPQPPDSNSEQPSQAPSVTASIFGSLRRLKGGTATSTPPKKVEKDNNRSRSRSSRKREEKSGTVSTATARGVTPTVDRNANVEGFNSVSATDGRIVNEQVFVRRRGKENVEEHRGRGDKRGRPESRVVTTIEREPLKKERVKSSTALNNLLRVQPKSVQSQQPKPKRPVTIAVPNNVSVRRGHKEGQGHPDNISRTSSVTNLDSLEANLQGQQGKGAKPRKVASKERIDKQTQDGKKVTKNNNKLEPPPAQPLSYSSESLHEAEIQQLKKQLRDMSDEKSSLALQLGEQRGQLNVLQKEIQKLKSFQEENNSEMDKLAEENTALRNRLRDVAHSPLSDNEKQQLLFESRHHSSAPASIATNVVDDNGGDVTTCTTPDWDKHSSSNVSDVSVACLQDKINQMQETHYSTNEELQATLQELTDLQRQLTELQQENERLNEEKTLMFDSLCRQTERLNDSRQEVENLKQFLYRDRSDENGITQLESVVEREQKLVELLRSAQEEREQLLLKLEQIQAELQDSRSENIDKGDVLNQQTERVKTLECTLDAKHAEHKQLDQELAQAKDHCSGKQIEINRLSDLLENARTKINELEQDRTLSDKSELDELLDNARKEKDQLESEVAYLKEQLARSKNEIEKLKDQVCILQEECKVTRNNAKTTQSDLEYKCEKLVAEKNTLGEQLQQFQEAVNELQVQAQCHLEDKRQLSAVLSETQRNLSEAERRNLNLETEIQELKKLRAEENDEWEKFQNDLLTSVRVANDFKTEAQQELQKIILENKTYREKLRLLEGQVEKLKGEKRSTSTQTDIILTPQLISLAKNLDQSIPNRISLLEHPVSSASSPTTPTSSMDKLFPILNKERRNRSRDNLSEDASKSSEMSLHRSQSKENLSSPGSSKKSSTKVKKDEKSKETPLTADEPKKEKKSFFRRNKSKDNLVEAARPVEGTSKESKGFFKKGKSKDDLKHFDEVSKDTPKLQETSKSSRGFLKRNKSKDNLEQYAEIDSGASKEEEGPLKNEIFLANKPRKSTDSSSSSSKSDLAKPEFFSKFIKKRDKKLLSHRKTMSVEEETLLKSLDNWYGNIDHNVPDEFLSKEDRAVKKLKILFEDDQLKERPVARKPKEQLAISKPLLNSVELNPKLKEIVRDPRVPTVETQVRESALEDTFTLVNEEPLEHHMDTDGPRLRIRSEEVYTNIGPKSLGIHKCQSLDDLNVFEEYRTDSELAPVLYRTTETDDLATEEHLEIKTIPHLDRPFSEIYPNDSVSNPRYSTKYHDDHENEYVANDLPKPNVYINYENLDEIINKLPKDVPESKLTEEQRFALKLKLALDDAEKRNTLKLSKKSKKSIKGLEISGPTPESVQKNWKLKEIMLNPGIKKAEEAKKDKFFLDLFDETQVKRHSIDISSAIDDPDEVERRPAITSKSYEDISFSFVPENTLMHMYYGKKGKHDKRPKITSDSSSSSHSFTSAEFNLDTGKITQKWDIPSAEVVVKQPKSQSEEDLLYNETINKEKNKKRHKQKYIGDDSKYQESLGQLKNDLSPTKTNTSNIENKNQVEADSWLKGSLERYKKDLNQMVKRIDSDQLRESLRKRGLKSSSYETQYQVAESEPVYDEYKVNRLSSLEVHTERQQDCEGLGKPHIKEIENTADKTVVSISYDTIKEFIVNEKKYSSDHDWKEANFQEKDTKTANNIKKSIERGIHVSFAGFADTENQSENSKFTKEDMPSREQFYDTEAISRERIHGTSHYLDSGRSLIKEVNTFSESHLVPKPSPKERTKVTLSFYDIQFQNPVEVDTQIETSNVTDLNKAPSITNIGKSETTEKADASISPDSFNSKRHVTVIPNVVEEEKAVDVSLLYNIINKFIFNEKIISEGYTIKEFIVNEKKYSSDHDWKEANFQEKDIKTANNIKKSIERDIHVSFAGFADTENQSENSKFTKEDMPSSEQFYDTEAISRERVYGTSHYLDSGRSLIKEDNSFSETHLVPKPSPKERTKVTLSFYDIQFQNPVEVDTQIETSNVTVLNKAPSITNIGKSETTEKADASISPDSFNSRRHVTVNPNVVEEEKAVDVSLLYNTINKFIFHEKIISEGYSNKDNGEINIQKRDLQHEAKLWSIENDFQTSLTIHNDTKEQFHNFGESQHYSSTEKTNDPIDVPWQSEKPYKKNDNKTEESSFVDFVNKRESYKMSHGLDTERSISTKEGKNLKSNHVVKPSPKGRSKFTTSFYDICFQNPIVINTHVEAPLEIKQLDTTDKSNFNSNSNDVNSPFPEEAESHKRKDAAINLSLLYQTISDFILNERIFTEGYNFQEPRKVDAENRYSHKETEVKSEEPIIFHCPTELIHADELVSKQNYNDSYVWETSHEDKHPFGIEAINSVQQDMFKNQNLTDRQNEAVKEFHIINEEVTSQLPATTNKVSEFKESLQIEDILEVLPETIPDAPVIDPTFSHSSALKLPSYNPSAATTYSPTLIDMMAPQTAEVTEEYSYKEILRENQYGVVSPLDLRYTYRGVVKEYKKKYPSDPTEENDEANTDGSDQSDLEYKEDFIDEFFKPPTEFDQGFSPKIENINYNIAKMVEVDKPREIRAISPDIIDQDVDIRRKEETVSQIDKEMQAIMEKYLHTRTSLIVKESGVDIDNKETNLELKTNLKKYVNFENLNEIDSRDSKENNLETRELEPIVVFENEDVKAVELSYLENTGDDEPLSLEDLKFIEEMKARYTSADTVSTISEKDIELPNITEEEIEHKYQNLTDEELRLIRSSKSDRYSRPLSDINERDLLLIDEISKRYFYDGSLPSSVRSSLQEAKEVLKVVEEEGTDIKNNIAIINVDNADANKDVIPPLPSSLPPKPFIEHQHKTKDTDAETLSSDVPPQTSDAILSDILKEFILNERLFSDSCNNIHNTNRNSIGKEFEISFTGPVITKKQLEASAFKESQQYNATEQKGVPDTNVQEKEQFRFTSSPNYNIPTAQESIKKQKEKGNQSSNFSKAEKDKQITIEDEFSHLPPSLRPRKPTAQRPVSFQQHGNVTYRDRSKLSSSQGLPNRPNSSIDRSSANRLSDLMFNETIFVPVSKDDRISSSPKFPLSPSYNHMELEGTWRNHDKPDFKQTIVVPTSQRVGSSSADTKGVQSPTPKSPAFKETIFIPSAVEPSRKKESTTSILSFQKTNKPGDLDLKETIIIPSQPMKSNFFKDPPKSPQPQTNVTTINRPGYHSYTETIIVPKPQESPEPRSQNLETLTLQKSVTQSKTSGKAEVKINFNRYSAIPKPIASTTTSRSGERRPLSEPFKLRSLDSSTKTYEPVYSNVNYGSSNYKAVFSSSIKKKPLPVPRGTEWTPPDKEYHAGTSFKRDSVKSKYDTFVNMTDSNENFSELLANTETPNTTNFAELQAKFSEGVVLKEEKERNSASPEHIVEEVVIPQENVPSDRLILVESRAETDILKNNNKVEPKESAESSRNSEKSYQHNATSESLNTKGMAQFVAKDEESVASGSSSTVKSATSFAMATKGEQLDISKVEAVADYVLEEDVEDVERKPSGNEISNVNLFTMDSHSSYDSYLEIFKSKESKDFDDLRGKKSPHKNFFGMAGFAYVEELESEDLKSDDIQDESKPKIVDFVPLDDDTTPFFTKEEIKESYDTLEREKTFHILGQASKISDKLSRESSSAHVLDEDKIDLEKEYKKGDDKDTLQTSLEVLAKKSSSFSKGSSKSHTDTSGTSFTQAKKIFEALVEANKDERPKTAVTSKSPPRYNNVRDSRSMDQIRGRGSKDSEVKQLGETGMLIKDGNQGPLNGGTPSK